MAEITRPCGNVSLAGITVAGVNGAALIPLSSADPFIQPTSVKIYVSGKAYVAAGDSATPSTTPPDGAAIQQASTEVVYALGPEGDPLQDYLWIYSDTGTIAADVSFFG